MKTTRIDIEGERGRATVFRSGTDIVINLTRRSGEPDKVIRRGIGRQDSWVIPARNQYGRHKQVAAQLQYQLDGYVGTAGDIEDYVRVIETFAD